MATAATQTVNWPTSSATEAAEPTSPVSYSSQNCTTMLSAAVANVARSDCSAAAISTAISRKSCEEISSGAHWMKSAPARISSTGSRSTPRLAYRARRPGLPVRASAMASRSMAGSGNFHLMRVSR